MERLTDTDRRKVATEWKSSGLNQPTYARSHGIKPRTLRAWRQRFCRDWQSVKEPLPSGESISTTLQVFEARLAALEDALEEVRAAVEILKVTVDVAPACRTVASNIDADVDEHEDEHQVASGMPGPAVVSAKATNSSAADVEKEGSVPAVAIDTERTVHEPGVEQTWPPTVGRRKRSFFADLEDSSPAAETEVAPTVDDYDALVQQPGVSAEHAAVPGERDDEPADSVRPLPFPRGWERGGGFLTF